jgi:hypothetical protein
MAFSLMRMAKMSSGERMKLADASAVASDFLEYIRDVSAYACIAGSIRRKKETVGDIEIVVEPTTKAALWNRLDVMVNMGTIDKALYGEKQAERWGDTHRGVAFMKAKVEIYTCDADNRGYITWLRTGSADKNQYVVTRMKQQKYPVRFADGYAWHVSYDRKHPMFDVETGYAKLNKLRVPDEVTIYHLLGMPMMPVTQREEQHYAFCLDKGMRAPSEFDLKQIYAGGQRSMF